MFLNPEKKKTNLLPWICLEFIKNLQIEFFCECIKFALIQIFSKLNSWLTGASYFLIKTYNLLRVRLMCNRRYSIISTKICLSNYNIPSKKRVVESEKSERERKRKSLLTVDDLQCQLPLISRHVCHQKFLLRSAKLVGSSLAAFIIHIVF